MNKAMREFNLYLFGLLFMSLSVSAWSQQDTETPQPVFTCDETVHNFGRIREVEGYAVHEFVVKNTGSLPLTINRVLTTCGCAQPEWSKNAIEPGQEGFVIVSYDMIDRPGPFSKNITVYTNERTLRHVLTIKGDVIPKPQTLNVLFSDTIGTVQLEMAEFYFNTTRPRESKTKEIWIQNYGDEDLKLTVDNVPDFLTVTVPERLERNYPDRMVVALNPSPVDEDMRGRKTGRLLWKTESASGKTVTRSIPVAANYLDDFSRLSPAERAESPSVQVSTDYLDYGKLKKKRVAKELTITNTGKSTLMLHSISVDDADVAQITGFNQQTLRPGEILKLKVFVNPKDVKGAFTTDLFIFSNDPRRPVREVQIAFVK